MGFWKTLFSDKQCRNCGSYNTERIDFQDLSERDQDMYWDNAGNIRPVKSYRCKDCRQLTIECENGGTYWTHPTD